MNNVHVISQDYHGLVDKAFRCLINNDGKLRINFFGSITPLKIKFCPKNEVKKLIGECKKYPGFPYIGASFSINITKDDYSKFLKQTIELNPQHSVKETTASLRYFFAIGLNDCVRSIILISNLAYPGIFNPIHSSTRVNSKLMPYTIRDASSKFEYFEGFYNKNFTFEEKKILHYNEWFLKNENITLDPTQNELGRGIAAYFQFLMSDIASHEYLHLIILMIGIEAIFVENDTSDHSIISQIKNKAASIFPEIENLDKTLSAMYRFRSKFIHGKIDMPIDTNYSEDAYKKYGQEFSDSTTLAANILTKTLQYAIERNWNNIRFKYTVSVHEQ